jgi:hypothetical protein
MPSAAGILVFDVSVFVGGRIVSRKDRKPLPGTANTSRSLPPKSRFRGYFLMFLLGAALATGAAFLSLNHTSHLNASSPAAATVNSAAGQRTVAQLIALSDAELEKVDIVEMNVAVAREIPGLEKLDYEHYRQIVDDWTDQLRRWLPTAERDGFRPSPEKYRNDINLFRLGMLAQFLDLQVSVAYNEELKQIQLRDRKAGRKSEIQPFNPGDVLLHGLIDTKRGTCCTMPSLHVAIGRRFGWPVTLAHVGTHFVCRYDDGKVVYNIEATDTGRGGFSGGSDQEYLEKEGLPRKAVDCGSDLRKLSAREMLGVYIGIRGQYFNCAGQVDLAAHDYALAFTQFPNNRNTYINLVGDLVSIGERLFDPNEHGHPAALAAYLADKYQPRFSEARPSGPQRQADPLAEFEAVNAMNRANMARMMPPQAPGAPPQGAYRLPQPGPIQPMSPPGPPLPR